MRRQWGLQCYNAGEMSSGTPRATQVVVLGDINVDILARIEKFPSPGEDCLSPKLELHCGGVGANVAIALAKWGVAVRLLGRVGRDPFGDLALGVLRREQVSVACVQQADHTMTGLIFIPISPDGQRTMFGSRAANAEFAAPAGDAGYLEGAQAAYLVGYSFLSPSAGDAALQVLEATHRRGGWVSLDVGVAPSRQVPEKILQVAPKVDILFLGWDEAATLTEKRDAPGAFAALEEHGVREVIMKLGDAGCLFRENGRLEQVPAFAIAVADTTGAGDAFGAAFLWARLHGWSKAEAAVVANAAGAVKASVVGAGENMPAPQQVLRLLRASRLQGRWDAIRVRVLERLREELGVEDSGISGRVE